MDRKKGGDGKEAEEERVGVKKRSGTNRGRFVMKGLVVERSETVGELS